MVHIALMFSVLGCLVYIVAYINKSCLLIDLVLEEPSLNTHIGVDVKKLIIVSIIKIN
jgi:hypothetical protein